MAETTKRGRGAPRQLYKNRKHLWLRNHPRRADILALVKSANGPISPAGFPSKPLVAQDVIGFDLTPEASAMLIADAAVVRARLYGQSWRQIAERATPKRSYETWRTIYRIYTEYTDDHFRIDS